MRLLLLEQITVGLALSLASMSALFAQSLSAAVTPLMLGLFFTATLLAARGLHAPNRILRSASWFMVAFWAAVMGTASLVVVERLVYVHADAYPQWLVHGTLKPHENVYTLRQGACKNAGPIEIMPRADGLFTLRCGSLWFFDSRTFVSTFDPSKLISGGAR